MSTDRLSPPEAPRGTAQRRLLTAAAGLAVAALAACAYVLTYDVLRDLAVAGRVPRRWAWAYPAMTDVMVAVVILSLVVARHARWWSRLVRWTLLAVLLAAMAAISVQHAVWGLASLPDDRLRAGVAIAPHVMLITAVWLWLTMFRHLRTTRRHPETATAPTEAPEAPAPEPIEPAPAPAPPVATPPAEPVHAPQDDDEPAPKVLVPSVPEPAGPSEPARPSEKSQANTTTRPDIPLPAPLPATDEDTELTPVDRAEDPDAGDEPDVTTREFAPEGDTTPNGETAHADDLPIWDWNPPSGSLRSSPTPPGDTERGA